MRRIKLLKSMTLCHNGGDPSVTLVRGHVDAETFNKATAREGWNGPEGLEVRDEDIQHVYYKKTRRKNKTWWGPTTADDKYGRKFTRNLW